MFDNSTISAEPAASLADYTSETLILPQLREGDTAGVIQELTQRLHQDARIPDVLPFYHATLNREFLDSTAMEHGMAFPHARLSGLQRLCFALGRSAAPIPWGTQHAKAVYLVFLLAVPATEAVGYLYIVSGLARLGKNPELMAGLREARDAAAMLAVLRKITLPHARGSSA